MNVQSTSQGPLKGNICTWSWKEASLSPHLSQPVFLFPLAVMSIPRQVYCCRVCVCAKLLSCVQLFATVGAIACQAPLSMGFSRQEYWSGLPCPPPGDLSDPGIEPMSLASPALAGRFFTTEPPGKPCVLLLQGLLCMWSLTLHFSCPL